MMHGLSRFVKELEFGWEEAERRERAIVMWQGVIRLSDQMVIMWDQVYSPGLAIPFLDWRSTLPSHISPGIPLLRLLYRFPSPYQHWFSRDLLKLFSSDGKSNIGAGAFSSQMAFHSNCFCFSSFSIFSNRMVDCDVKRSKNQWTAFLWPVCRSANVCWW